MLKLINGMVSQKIKDFFGLDSEFSFSLAVPPTKDMGDLCFSCFTLSKTLGGTPNEIANALVSVIGDSEELKSYISEIKVEGPYLNIFLNWTVLAKVIFNEIDSGGYGCSNQYLNERIMLEYSAPNTNKPQHLGHIRNNCLGQAIVNLLRKQGCEVFAVNLINDRGIHICKSMTAYKLWGQDQTPASTGEKGDHFVGRFYVLFEENFRKELSAIAKERVMDVKDIDPEKFFHESQIGKMAQDMLVDWENGVPEVKELWEKMNGWVYDGFNKTYRRLGCSFDKIYYESQTYLLGKDIVEDGLQRGVFYRDENGAVWCDLTQEGLKSKLLLRADGTSVYLTQDLGTAMLREKEYSLNRSLYVVASEQQHHFKVLIAVLKKMGFEWANTIEHVVYGMVYLPEGRMKSREGKVVDADNLMDLMTEIAKQRLDDDPVGKRSNWVEGEKEGIAERVGLAAIKFFILNAGNRTQDIHFDPSKSIAFEGKTGPYLLYAYVRMSSIVEKMKDFGYDPDFSLLTDQQEVSLLMSLLLYPEVIEKAAKQINPAELCDYLYKLASNFNAFYVKLPVLSAGSQELVKARMALTKMTKVVMQDGLEILGITPPTKM